MVCASDVHLPGRAQEVDCAAERFMEPNGCGHRQIKREWHRHLPLRHEEITAEPLPSEPFVKPNQTCLADQQAEVNITLLSEKIKRPSDSRAGKTSHRGQTRWQGGGVHHEP